MWTNFLWGSQTRGVCIGLLVDMHLCAFSICFWSDVFGMHAFVRVVVVAFFYLVYFFCRLTSVTYGGSTAIPAGAILYSRTTQPPPPPPPSPSRQVMRVTPSRLAMTVRVRAVIMSAMPAFPS